MSAVKDKNGYLKKLTSRYSLTPTTFARELDGTTPPSVFVGAYNYPKVYAGPMATPQYGDTAFVDTPETWIPGGYSTEDIVGFRLNLLRGKKTVDVSDDGSRYVNQMQEIAMAASSPQSHMSFESDPRGAFFNGRHTPHGPSAKLAEFEASNCRWNRDLERAHYDFDLKAADAVTELHQKGVPFSNIQKAFSVASFGGKRGRKLVPTRWSITACDTIIGDRLLKDVRQNEVIDHYLVHEYASLNNRYTVILTPQAWEYEWMEAFLHVMGSGEVIFSDHEGNLGKKGYSSVGGCYYSSKMGVLEHLKRKGAQAGAIILREAYKGYVPLGVFNVRENVRAAMAQKPTECSSLGEALSQASEKLRLPLERFIHDSTVLQDHIRSRQTRLTQYMR